MPNLFNLIDTVNVNDARELLASEEASAALNKKRAGRSPLAHAERALTRGTEELEQARSNEVTSAARIEMLQGRVDGISEIMGLIRDKMEELANPSEALQTLFQMAAIKTELNSLEGQRAQRQARNLVEGINDLTDLSSQIATAKI